MGTHIRREWSWLTDAALARFMKRRQERVDQCRDDLREANMRLREMKAELALRNKLRNVNA
jgi:hypothetical protein